MQGKVINRVMAKMLKRETDRNVNYM